MYTELNRQNEVHWTMLVAFQGFYIVCTLLDQSKTGRIIFDMSSTASDSVIFNNKMFYLISINKTNKIRWDFVW